MTNNNNVLLRNPQELLRNLPLLEYTASLYPQNSLDNTVIICVQHLASTTYTLLHKLISLGLRKEDLHVLGKCYSTNPAVYEALKIDGIKVSNKSMAFDSHVSYDSQHNANIKQFFGDCLKSLKADPLIQQKKIIVLDDGGYLLELANSQFPEEWNVAGVEQTSAGYRKLSTQSISFPIVNVARSRAKLQYESPIISKLILKRMEHHIDLISEKIKNVLIIGNGAIGKSVYNRLKSNFDVHIYDVKTKRSDFRSKELNKYIGDYDLLVGCSGSKALSIENYPYLNRPVYLVSASSSDREFDAHNLRLKHPAVKDPHVDLDINGINLVNCGFPLPFDNAYNEIDVNELQLTRSLLLAGIIQAKNSAPISKGLVKLSSKYQNKVISFYTKHSYSS